MNKYDKYKRKQWTKQDDFFAVPRKLGIMRTITYNSGISTTDPSFDAGYVDYLRAPPVGIYVNTDTVDFNEGGLGNDYMDFSWAVSLDDVVCTTSSAGLVTAAFWQSGSRAAFRSWTSLSGNTGMNAGGTWEQLLDKNVNRLVSPMFGGFDGLNISPCW